LLVHLVLLVERDVPEPRLDLVREDQGGRRRDARQRCLAQGDACDATGVVSGQRVPDEHAGVHADHGESLMTERVHQPDEVVGERAGVVAVLRLVGEADAALVDGDDLEVAGQRRHDQTPVVPTARPAVDQQQRRAVAADHGVQAHVAGVYEAAREGVGEPGAEVRRAGHRAGTLRDGQGRCAHGDSPFTRAALRYCPSTMRRRTARRPRRTTGRCPCRLSG
jgi:hypothetical protein